MRALLVAVTLVVAACVPAQQDPTVSAPPTDVGSSFPPAPPVPEGTADPEVLAAADLLVASLGFEPDEDAVAMLAASGDARVAWFLADVLRFVAGGSPVADALVEAIEQVTGLALGERAWVEANDHLIAWDLPAPDGYVAWKRSLYTLIDPRWEPLFADPDAAVDWRLVSWGGVLIDDRPLGDGEPCTRGCIPALDDPAVTPAAGGDWYAGDRVVFGVVVNGAARAYPRHMMEVHEMVNDTLGGRRLGIPYCTLCGSAQAYLTDAVEDDALVLRTSGLLSRSNKMMYELGTGSVFDTFTGEALSGPLREQGVTLGQATVVTSTWAAWKEAHPETTILAEDGGIGRRYDADPLGGRDDDGPIFPIGPVDPRLPVQEPVLGVTAPDGAPVAFPVAAALDELEAGGEVSAAGVVVVRDGGGLRAEQAGGAPVPSHQAFWFAWSQFHPDTLLWVPPIAG